MGTRDVARDMDVMRAAVGDEKLSYAGYSYGTELGTAYAEAFPQRVRALVLDGAIDPTQSTIDSSVKQAAGFQLAFDDFAKDCATKPNCPLGTDPAQATARFQALTRPLIEKPVPVGDGRTLSYTDALTGMNQALYVSELWPVLPRGISEVASGQGRILTLLADSYYERDQEGSYGNCWSRSRRSAVSTSSGDRPGAGRASSPRRPTQARAVPRRRPGRRSRRRTPARSGRCRRPATRTRPNAPGLPPTVVVSTTGDPATPYQAGVDLAAGSSAAPCSRSRATSTASRCAATRASTTRSSPIWST